MDIKDLDRDQMVTVLLIGGVLFGLLGLPLILQDLYNIDAIKVAFGVIIVYALINWYMKKEQSD